MPKRGLLKRIIILLSGMTMVAGCAPEQPQQLITPEPFLSESPFSTPEIVIVQRPAITSADFLKVNGKEVCKDYGKGEAVKLRGTNVGGYMLQEFWMTPTAYNYENYKVTCEMDIYMTLTDRFGEETMRSLVGVYQDNYWTEADFDNCVELGMNVIRLPVWYMNFVDFNGEFIPDAFDRLDWFIDEAGKRGIYVIIDMHGAPGSQSGSDHSGVDGGNHKKEASEFFFGDNAKKNQKLFYDIWARIAQQYSDSPVVAGYDLLNEPYCTYRYSSGLTDKELHTMLWDIYDNAYKAIRKEDPDHIIIMEATWDPVDLPDPSLYGWTNVMYQYHNYLYDKYNNENNAQVASLKKKIDLVINKGYDVPSLMGEFNLMSNTQAWQKGLQLLNDAGLSWTIWTYKVKGSNNNWGLYNQNIREVNVATDSEEEIRSGWSQVGSSAPNTKLINAIRPYFTAP